MSWEYKQPVRIIFGNGSIERLSEEIKKLGGHRGVLITSAGFHRRGYAETIVKKSEGLLTGTYSDVSPNPTTLECDECCRLLQREHADFVVALGGGSVMDCAKAASAFCLADRPSADYIGGASAVTPPKNHLPLIAVPTTAGTGSEVTSVAVISDHSRGLKTPLSSDAFYPVLAIVDPELTYTVPPHTAAATGFDVLCHAIEAYWSVRHQPICDSLAIRAALLAMNNIEGAVREAEKASPPYSSHDAMAEASVVAGLAFSLPKTTSAHACSYPLTNRLGIAHGEACALTISSFIRFNASHGCRRVDSLARLLGQKNADALADRVDEMRRRTGMLMSLKPFRLGKEQIEQLVRESKHPNMRNNPIEVPESFLRNMYNQLAKE